MSISTLTLLQFSQWGIAFIAVSAMLLILWRKTLLVKPFTEVFMPLDRTAIQSHAKLNVGLNWILGFAYTCLFMSATTVFDLPFEKSVASVFIPFLVLCIPIFIFAKMRMKRDVPLEYPGMSNLWNFIALRGKSIEKAHLAVGGDGSADTLGRILHLAIDLRGQSVVQHHYLQSVINEGLEKLFDLADRSDKDVQKSARKAILELPWFNSVNKERSIAKIVEKMSAEEIVGLFNEWASLGRLREPRDPWLEIVLSLKSEKSNNA